MKKLNYRPENVKEMQKTIYLSWLGSFLVLKKKYQKIWLKILRHIAIKLATGKVAKLCAILIKS